MCTYKNLDLYVDGSSLGNPGEAGVGIVFVAAGETVKNISKPIGKQTNNFAEYTALILALREAQTMKAKTINIYSDSELLCRQLKGEYKVKNKTIKDLFAEASILLKGFENYAVLQIPREKNKGADKLARLAAKNLSS